MNVKFDNGWKRDDTRWDVLSVKIWTTTQRSFVQIELELLATGEQKLRNIEQGINLILSF